MNQRQLILVVDGREESLILFHQILQHSGYDVVLAASAPEGLAQARKHRPDLILMDPALTDSAGDELVEQLRSHPETAATPIAALGTDPGPFDGALRDARFCGIVSNRSPLRILLAAVRRCLEATGAGAWPGGAAPVAA